MKTYSQQQLKGNQPVDSLNPLKDQAYTVRFDQSYARNLQNQPLAQSRKTPRRTMDESQWATYDQSQNISTPPMVLGSNASARNQWTQPRREISCTEEFHTGNTRHKRCVSSASMSTFEIGQAHLNHIAPNHNAIMMANANAPELSWEALQMGSSSRTDIVEQPKNFETNIWDTGDYTVLPSRFSSSRTLPSDSSGADSLQKACFHGRTTVVSLLLTNGASLVRKNSRGQTAFHLAASQGHTSILKLLLSSSKSKHNPHMPLTHALDDTGLAPLHLASLNGHCAAIRLLLNTNADDRSRLVDMADSQGRTPLHIAAEEGHVEVVQLLLERGAKINARMTNGLTALHAASERGHDAVVRLLLEWGADAEARSAEGQGRQRGI